MSAYECAAAATVAFAPALVLRWNVQTHTMISWLGSDCWIRPPFAIQNVCLIDILPTVCMTIHEPGDVLPAWAQWWCFLKAGMEAGIGPASDGMTEHAFFRKIIAAGFNAMSRSLTEPVRVSAPRHTGARA